ncbi:MAG TPA: hypothetical protein VNZ64_08815 [Candidatus Acidoferrum sp.]|jgi:hypothetical protein|nr:hypothetical protein [Candidatus Acidoferrum sp.]
MNTQATAPDSAPAPDLSASTLPLPIVARRLKGKIPSLPKAQRDAINNLLLEGATYGVVVQRMAERGVELNAENVSNWYQTGFQNFLAHLERSDYQRSRYEAAADLLQDTDASKLPQAGLQTAAAQIYDLLGHFTATAVGQNVADDPDKYTRIVNSLSRLARETLALQKYQDACAKARAALHELKDPKRKLTDSERRAIVRHVDDILGISSDDIEDDPPELETIGVTTSPADSPSAAIASSSSSEAVSTTA